MKILKNRLVKNIFIALIFILISAIFSYSFINSKLGYKLKMKLYYSSIAHALYTESGAFGTYSTSEKAVGEWIDGRTVYEKTVPITLPSTTSSISPHGISNFGALISLDVRWYDTEDNRWHVSPRNYSSATISYTSPYTLGTDGFTCDGTNIYVTNYPNDVINWAARSTNAYVIIRYVKTS